MVFSDLFDFLNTPANLFVFILVLGVIFVNGFTDAPNAISGIVCSKIWSMRKACVVAGAFNLLGVFLSSLMGARVAESVFNSADFGKYTAHAVCACLIGVILFGVISWLFAMPSSESHALISCIFGATLAISGSYDGFINFAKIIFYMLLSCIFTVIFSFVFAKLFKKSRQECLKYEPFACIGASFMHGAQDGQKFIALIMFLILQDNSDTAFSVPFYVSLFVGVFMLLGTLTGGGRIINSLGDDLVKTDERLAFLSDISATVCLFLCSALGFAVSTGNIKACSSLGAGYAERLKINYKTLKKIIIVSLITFPICILMGYLLTSLFILIF